MTAFLNYVEAKYEAWAQGYIFNVYASDAMQFLVKAWGGDIQTRYVDIIKPQKQDNRSGEEIAAEIIKRHGLKVVG